MKKTLLSLCLLSISIPALAKAPLPAESVAQSQPAAEKVSASDLLRDAATIGKVRIESYAAPQILAVNAVKMYRGRGNPQKYMGGWLEGKSYSIDISGRAWKKTWEAMNPKFDPLGKEVMAFIASNGQLEAWGEIKGDKVQLSCSRASQPCQVEPAEIPLSSLKVEKPL